MRLSEAIRLGSLLITNPEAGKVERCAIGMANLATNGYQVTNTQESVEKAYAEFIRSFPWVSTIAKLCPMCGRTLHGRAIIWHLFDFHVMNYPAITIDQLADYIATIEPKEPEETTDVHLRDMQAVESA